VCLTLRDHYAKSFRGVIALMLASKLQSCWFKFFSFQMHALVDQTDDLPGFEDGNRTQSSVPSDDPQSRFTEEEESIAEDDEEAAYDDAEGWENDPTGELQFFETPPVASQDWHAAMMSPTRELLIHGGSQMSNQFTTPQV
jgi:hypothetical protein